MDMIRLWAPLWERLRTHAPFYVASICLGLAFSTFFLLNRDAGPNWAWQGLPLDDAWIHLVYARSLAEDGWFYYNSGVPEAGMSSPLWVISLALPLKLGASPALAAKSLSILFGLIASALSYHTMRDLTDRTELAWAAGLIVALLPNFSYARVSGMEVTLVGALVLLSAWLYLQKRYLAYGLVTGLAVIARGETAILWILFGGIVLVRRYLNRDRLIVATRREVSLGIKLFLPALILGGSWALYNYAIGGKPLPNTYYVKHNFGLGLINPTNLANIWMGYFRHSLLTWKWLVIPFIAISILGGRRLFQRHGIGVLPILIVPWLTAYILSTNVAVNPEEWNFTARRYLDYILPLLIFPFLLGLAELWDQAGRRSNRMIILGAPLVFGAVALAYFGLAAIRLNALAAEYSWNTRNIEETSVAMGRWIADQLPPDAEVGVTDAGAMRFYGGRETIDLLGLNNHMTIGRPLQELILEYEPDFAILFRGPEIDSWPFLTEIHNIRPERNTILGGGDLVAYKYIGDQ